MVHMHPDPSGCLEGTNFLLHKKTHTKIFLMLNVKINNSDTEVLFVKFFFITQEHSYGKK